MRSSAICLWFWRISCCIGDLSRFYLMYSAPYCGEELCVLDPLCKINMIWHLLHKYSLLFPLRSNMLWCCYDLDLLWYFCDLDLLWCCYLFCYDLDHYDAAICYDVTMVYSISSILMSMRSVLSLLHFHCIMSWDILWMMLLYWRYCDKCMMQSIVVEMK